MNLGEAQSRDAILPVLPEDDDDAVDPHLERIKNEAGGDESDEEVSLWQLICCQLSVGTQLSRLSSLLACITELL